MGEQNDDAENEGTPDHDEYDSVKEIGNSSVPNSNSSLALDDTDGNTSMGGDIIADLGDVKISVNCASYDQVMPPHRPRVRQTTETTMIMSNKSQNVHDFFTVPVEIEAGENEVEGKEFELDHSSDQKPASWGRGISDDFKNTIAKHWKTEITNFRVKTVAVSLFLFFACIAPAVSPLMILRDLFIFLKIIRKCRIFLIMFGVRFKITFGTMYSKITHHSIGTVEMLFGTASCGILFALFGGQPMMINGGTGPVLAFTGVLYKLSDSIGVPFLTFYAWCGLWVALFMILAAFADLNKIILFATRFTDEIFSFLIATIFIIDSLGSPFHEVGVFYYFKQDPLDVALLSLIACLGTTYIAYVLRGVKFSSYLWAGWMRNLFSDFAISIAIFVFTILANLGFPSIHLEELDVPSTVNPTYVCCHADCTTFYPADCPELETPFGPRPWRVNLLDLNGKTYVIFMAAGPALLAFILVFLDNGITMHLMNHPAHKIAHGSAYNYDTVVIGIMIAVCSLYGFPWLVAATVRSLNHLHALAEKSSDGKTFYSVHETRLTGLFAHCLILGSLFALDIIRLIPVPVLYGVFLYMGFTTLPSNQFWNRILLFFMQPSKYTDANNEVFIENVKTWRIHLYTIIQLSLFLLLFVIKSMKPIAIAFPIIIAAFIPIRFYIMPRLFTEDELILLDSGDDELIEEWLEEHGKSRTMKYVDPRSHNGLEVHHMSLCGSVRGSGSIRSMPSRSSSIVSALHA